MGCSLQPRELLGAAVRNILVGPSLLQDRIPPLWSVMVCILMYGLLMDMSLDRIPLLMDMSMEVVSPANRLELKSCVPSVTVAFLQQSGIKMARAALYWQ